MRVGWADQGPREERGERERETWLPDGYSQIFRSYVFGP